jgi:hypothetical protein
MTGLEPAPLDDGNVVRYQLRHVRMEPARRIELRLHPYRGCVLPLPLGRRELGAQDSDLKPSASKAAALPVELPPIKGLRRVPPRLLTYKVRCSLELEAECARPDLNRDAPRGALAPRASASAIPPRAHESRHPGSNRAVRCTKAEPQAVRGGKAGIPGFEPGELPGQSRAGLPIPPYPIECGRRDSNAQTARLSWRGLPVAVTSAYAAGDSNPELTD